MISAMQMLHKIVLYHCTGKCLHGDVALIELVS